MIRGFLKYGPELATARKINSIRIGQSRPDLAGVPILTEGDVLFSSAAEAGEKPRSCYNCPLFNYERSCKLFGKDVEIRKFTWPEKIRDGAKPIEYWPVCGYWVPGEPNYGVAEFIAKLDPGAAGLGWVNAPRVGQELSGTSCGGANGGDDCDFWIIEDEDGDKREAKTGFCRVMQKQTENGACCSCWTDDDLLSYQMVAERFRENKP